MYLVRRTVPISQKVIDETYEAQVSNKIHLVDLTGTPISGLVDNGVDIPTSEDYFLGFQFTYCHLTKGSATTLSEDMQNTTIWGKGSVRNIPTFLPILAGDTREQANFSCRAVEVKPNTSLAKFVTLANHDMTQVTKSPFFGTPIQNVGNLSYIIDSTQVYLPNKTYSINHFIEPEIFENKKIEKQIPVIGDSIVSFRASSMYPYSLFCKEFWIFTPTIYDKNGNIADLSNM